MNPAALQAGVRLLDLALRQDEKSLISERVAEFLASTVAAERVDLVMGGGGWKAEWTWPKSSRSANSDWPSHLFSESLDRGAATAVAPGGNRPAMLVSPLDTSLLPNRLLLASRSRGAFQRSELELFASLAPTVAAVLVHGHAATQRAQRVRQLESLLDVTRQLALARDTQSLMERIASESTRLLDADRASIFVWDRENKQLVARPALGVSGGELRVPDNFGIVGDVLASGQPAIVHDVRQDPRFGGSIDSKSGYQTRSLICVPLVDATGQRVGVFEVINKKTGQFDDDDRATLELLGAQVTVALANTIERESLLRANAQFTDEASTRAQIIGATPAIEALRATVQRVANTNLPVLILGESGTGKEVVARAIHYGSPRRSQPFIPVNCAAIAESLLESELFGHEKGAFTDARETRQGKFELASGGTLLLDEIGDMSAGGQAKLLRVLEEKTVYRVGGSQPIHTDARIIAATNRNLADAVAGGKFRQDLFFRLTVVTVGIPPLRERRDDVLTLAEHFLEQFCRDARRAKLKLSAEAKKRLAAHEWPGNVRELRNLMERLAFLSPNPTIEADDLAFILMQPTAAAAGAPAVPTGLNLSDATDHFQRDYIATALDRARGNQAEAARLLGLHRSNLYRKMRQLGMEAT
jgi:Nif-specific regulatory protein